jgi:hypothetical protein
LICQNPIRDHRRCRRCANSQPAPPLGAALIAPPGALAVDTVADLLEPPAFLESDMDQLAKVFALMATQSGRFEVA